MIQIKKLTCYFASEILWLWDPVWVKTQDEDFSTIAPSDSSCEIPKCGSSSDKWSIIPVLFGFFSSLPAGLSCSGFSRGWEQNYFCRKNIEKWRGAVGSVLWPVLRLDEHCVKIRELFCNGREEIFIGFHCTCQPQLCGHFFTDAKLK